MGLDSGERPVRRFTTAALAAIFLLAGITVVLQTVSAVSVTLTPSATTVAPDATMTFTMAVTYDTDEHIPVIYNRLIFEGPSPPGPIALDIRWIVDGSIITNGGCSGTTVALSSSGLGGVAGYGSGTETWKGLGTGYGYDSGAGHGATGYGSGAGFDAQGYAGSDPLGDAFAGYGAGDGYGYDNVAGEGTITYTISLPTTCLSTGTFRVTGVVVTDYWDFESLFKDVTISSSGGGGGTTPPGTTPTGTGSGETQKVTATTITAPTGALFASKATVATASAGNKIEVATGDSVLPTVTITMATAVTNLEITFVRWPATATADQLGTGAIPSGINTAYFFTITLSTGSASSASLVLKIPQAAVTSNVERAILLRYVGTAWNPEAKISFSLVGGNYEATVNTPCCSVFSVAFDETPPTVDFTPPGGPQSGIVDLQASATDNIQVTRVVWFAGDTQIGEDTSSPYQLSLNTATLTNGDHTLKAVAHDFAGNTAEESGTMTVQNEAAETETEAPSKPKAINTLIIIIIVIVVILLVVGAFVLAGKKPPAKKP